MSLKKGLTAVLLVVLAGGLAIAADGESRVRGHVIWVNPLSDSTIDGLNVEADSAVGLEGSWEFPVSDIMGVNLTLGTAKHDIEVQGTTIGDVRVSPFTGTLLFHITPDSNVDFYFGPGLSYVIYGDLEANNGDKESVDNDLGLALEVGLDMPLGDDGWSFNINAKYIGTSAETNDAEVDIDPLVLGVGVGYRF